jgi:hypothetical protein
VRPGTLLIATAVIEIAVGVPLLITPTLVAQLLLGTQLPTPASQLVARIAGAALLAIGVSCWLERRRRGAAAVTGLVGGLLVYNAAVCALLTYAGLVDGLGGIGLWPACALHLAMTICCILVMLAGRRARLQPTAGPQG